MPMSLWTPSGSVLAPVERVRLDQENRLEDWLAADISLLGHDFLLIGRQVVTDHGGRIDLLAMDGGGSLVVLELKRDRTPRDALAQLLDYASWVSLLERPEIERRSAEFLGRPLDDAFRERFGAPLPERLNLEHRLFLVASQLDPASQRIVEYLSRVHRVSINTAFFSVFKHDEQELVAADWLLDEALVEDRASSRTKAPWTGIWFVNVEDHDYGTWADQVQYGYLAAGGGPQYTRPLDRLKPDAPVFAFMAGKGYVGVGKARAPAGRPSEVVVDGRALSTLVPALADRERQGDHGVRVVPVDWVQTDVVEQARWKKGLFANSNIVCKLNDEATAQFVLDEFKVERALLLAD